MGVFSRHHDNPVEDLGTDYEHEPVKSGQVAVDGLVRLLDLEQVEQDIFRGRSPDTSHQRVFGGQVAGQALVACGRTVDTSRHVHSLHSYFIRPGDPSVPIVYTVDRVRDGRSFSVRRTIAVQHGQPIFALSASFQVAEGGLDHQTPMPEVPAPEDLPTHAERLEGLDPEIQDGMKLRLNFPFDIRYVDDPPWIQREHGPRDPDTQRVWMKAAGRLPNDQLTQVCALTFASDLTLLESVLIHHGLSWRMDPLVVASLDHAMWFHRSFRADEWFLYESQSPSASGGRGLAFGRFYSRDGRHIATVMQEGLMRVVEGGPS